MISSAANAPFMGDPWFSSTITINKDSLPTGVEINSAMGLINHTENPLILIYKTRQDPYLPAKQDNLILPPELSGKYHDFSTTTSVTSIIKLVNGEEYDWTYMKKLPPGAGGTDFDKIYYEWDWDGPNLRAAGAFNITESSLISMGAIEPLRINPCLDQTGDTGTTTEGYREYKRPDNVSIPGKKSFNLSVFYAGKEIYIPGTISYSLQQNYRARDGGGTLCYYPPPTIYELWSREMISIVLIVLSLILGFAYKIIRNNRHEN
jgi:hypothetical protein